MPRSATPWAPDFAPTRMGRGFASDLPCQAPSEGDQPFVSLPFAHPIPQSRRRESGDLFSASLNAEQIVVSRFPGAGEGLIEDFPSCNIDTTEEHILDSK
jgi:hypothetical protein